MRKSGKHQVVVIHGGDTFSSRAAYLASLRHEEADLESSAIRGWKANLAKVLGRNFQVIAPRMPNKDNARYEEWIIRFKKYLPFLNNGVILVGHSLGGIFLAKYLSQNRFPRKMGGILLVAPPYAVLEPGQSLVDFALPKNMKRLADYKDLVTIYHSRDDEIVPFSNLKGYISNLPNAKVKVFKDRNHFSGETFPEIVKDVKTLILSK